MTHQGSCHCGGIRFEVEGEPDRALSCNCSICQRKDALLWFLPRSKLRLLTPVENMATYTFNKHVIKHRFCPVCGIHAFEESLAEDGTPMAAINIRCMEGINLNAVPVQHVDGLAL